MPPPDQISALVYDYYGTVPAPTHQRAAPRRESVGAFFTEIEKCWSDLASNLARRNPQLSQRELNFAVQKTIDRILFLRLGEDRGIEPDGQLHGLLNGPNIYARLGELFRHADHRYHSSLFHFTGETDRTEPPDEWTLSLSIDDRILNTIIRNLYHPHCPVEFSSLGADILGQVYERFLGKTIRLTEDHRALVEDRPGIKKTGGVYYTPSFIVDYIVERTVGTLLDGKTAYQIAARTPMWRPAKRGRPLAVLDPACGSGAFLLSAYQYLLDWYRDWYASNNPARHQGRIYRSHEDEWRLTTTERQRILLDHIYGVDIDPQAVEVTKLSLLLKAIEGDRPQPRQRELPLPHHTALPGMANTIKCGNSLIGPDFYEGQQPESIDEDERRRINAFDWKAAFPTVVATGGFDAVIGNPPYLNVRLVTQSLGDKVKTYFRRKYQTAYRGYDLYVLFAERPFHLLRAHGRWGMIIPNKIATLDYALECRKLLLQRTTLAEIVDVSKLEVFSTASVYPYIIIWEKTAPRHGHRIQVKHVSMDDDLQNNTSVSQVAQSDLTPETGLAIHGSLRVEDRVFTQPLSERARLHSGTTGFAAQKIAACLLEKRTTDDTKDRSMNRCLVCETGTPARHRPGDGQECPCYDSNFSNDAECHSENILPSPRLRGEGPGVRGLRPGPECFDFIVSGNIDRYSIAPGNVRFMNRNFSRPTLPASEDHLSDNKRTLYAGEKIVIAGMTRRLEAAYDPGGLALGVQVYAAAQMLDHPKYLLGLLNSKLLSYLFRIRFAAKHLAGGFLAINKGQLAQLPIRVLDQNKPEEREWHDNLAWLVDRMMALRGRLMQAENAHVGTALQHRINATDRQIDQLVYELYGLTDEEIRTIEETMRE